METKVKTKVRFTSLDIAAMVAELKGKLIGCRLTNIYDLSPSTYLFKMSRGDDKHYLLCENGMRFHTTESKAEKNKMPSGFTMKFRKFLRSKRLEAIRQVGMERVVVLTFGQEQFSNHLILELYSQGNIILTDQNYRILQCMRSHQFTDKIKTAVGELYPFQYAANIYLEKIDVSKEKIEAVIKEVESVSQEEPKPEAVEEDKGKKGKKKKEQKKSPSIKLKDMIFKLIPCLFPQVIDHILTKGNYPGNERCTLQNLELTAKAAEDALNFTKTFQSEVHPGYLLINQNKDKQEPSNEEKTPQQLEEDNKEKYVDYAPYLHIAYENKPHRKFDSFSKAVDLYYSVFKKPQEGDELEELAWRKYEQIKKDQDARVGKLRTEQQQSQLRAELIEKNIDDVDAVIRIFRTMLDNGYSWGQVEKMLHEAKKSGDPLANMVHAMHLDKGTVDILLGDPSAEDQLSDLLPVEVKIEYNAYTNATNYYESRKKNYQKEVRTKEASQHVLKIAEKEAIKDLEKRKNQRQGSLVSTRKPYWFEKFYWFISSQGYLVISGRDSHQNEIIVKKYMRAGDLYMHSDYGGAASTVIKNPSKEPVPRLSLQEAAIFTVCRSKAWDTKIISGAWWVYNDQVSKSAPTGEFLPTGSFMIRGKKNFVYPNRMEMGITLLYRVGQDCLARHMKDPAELGEIGKLDSQKSEIEVAHEQKLNNEEFSIINLEQAPKKMQQQQQKGQKKGDKKDQTKQQPKKEDVKAKEQSQVSDQESEEQVNEQNEQKTQKKQPVKQQQKNSKKEVEEPKKAYVNKKKLKKLEKYMEEQDEEERQIIMKMLGAKEMKHMRDPDEEEEEKEGKKKDKEKEKSRKEKKNKFHIGEETEEAVIDKEKVLFLKDQPKQQNKYVKAKKEEPQVQKKTAEKSQQNSKLGVSTSETQPIKSIEPSASNESVSSSLTAPVKIEEVSEEKTQGEQKEDSSSGSDGEEQKDEKKEDIHYDEDDKVLESDINELGRLVGKLYPEDNYDCLITMCAPYPTITENHFKIKLTPGGLKKGKAARNILHYFSTLELSEREKQLIKTFPQQEIINALLGNVKLGAAGMLKLELKEKAEKKEKRKEKDKQKVADKK